MCGSSKETAKSLGSEVPPLVRAAPLSQQLHINRPAYPSCAAALPGHGSTEDASVLPRRMITLRIQTPHILLLPRQLGPRSNAAPAVDSEHKESPEVETLCLKTPSRVADGIKSVLSLME